MEQLNCIITEEYTVMQALERLDEVEPKVLFVTQNGKLCATVTDGDVRRAILKKISLTSPVKKIANYSPRFVKNGDEEFGLQLLTEKQLPAVPVVNAQLEIVGICKKEHTIKKEEQNLLDVPIVIMAGGLGTRLYPYTRILPKPLIPVGELPISERIIQSFRDIGCKNIYMIINYKKNMIRSYFNDSDCNYNIHFIDENEPMGTGGGLYFLKDIINSTFILTNCDILILEDVRKIVEHHNKEKNKVTMVCSLKNFEIPYGIVNFTEGGEISSFVEKPHMSYFTNTGYYVLEKEVFDYISKDEKIGMPDIIERMKDAGEKIGIFPISENSWLDMGQFDTMESMERKLKEFNLY